MSKKYQKATEDIAIDIYNKYVSKENMAVALEGLIQQINRDINNKINDLIKRKGLHGKVEGMKFPQDFDGAHHVNKAQERLDKFNKDNPVDNLQDLM
jgi:hypothetical protein